ncbi:PspC domain-containing protein [Bacillus sp. NTK071]|uniref:PspC domain-containing protein n=1 Tax=Bacillus sp. NTK071 TaxID=2802175 RepID=UPI001A9048DF|nr:PspC domain-containing protein [Bacillus sp. NTK071]MBN8209089.1 PspC domain-containing protein [Bacillus sp. NTK071]
MKKFYKSTSNKVFSGVLGGLSEAFNINSSLLRIIYVLLTVFTSGVFLLVYVAAAFLLPKDREVKVED